MDTFGTTLIYVSHNHVLHAASCISDCLGILSLYVYYTLPLSAFTWDLQTAFLLFRRLRDKGHLCGEQWTIHLWGHRTRKSQAENRSFPAHCSSFREGEYTGWGGEDGRCGQSILERLFSGRGNIAVWARTLCLDEMRKKPKATDEFQLNYTHWWGRIEESNSQYWANSPECEWLNISCEFHESAVYKMYKQCDLKKCHVSFSITV